MAATDNDCHSMAIAARTSPDIARRALRCCKVRRRKAECAHRQTQGCTLASSRASLVQCHCIVRSTRVVGVGLESLRNRLQRSSL
eukprot:6017145-Prymnesium_polylepis.2